MSAAYNGHTECLSVLLNSGAAVGDKSNVCKIEHNIYMMYVCMCIYTIFECVCVFMSSTSLSLNDVCMCIFDVRVYVTLFYCLNDVCMCMFGYVFTFIFFPESSIYVCLEVREFI